MPDLVLQGHIIPSYIVLPTPAMLSARATLCALMRYAALYIPLYRLLQLTVSTALLGSMGGCVQVGGQLQMDTHGPCLLFTFLRAGPFGWSFSFGARAELAVMSESVPN